MVKRLPGGRRIHSVRVSAQTEPWGPDSCTGMMMMMMMMMMIVMIIRTSIIMMMLAQPSRRARDPHDDRPNFRATLAWDCFSSLRYYAYAVAFPLRTFDLPIRRPGARPTRTDKNAPPRNGASSLAPKAPGEPCPENFHKGQTFRT